MKAREPRARWFVGTCRTTLIHWLFNRLRLGTRASLPFWVTRFFLDRHTCQRLITTFRRVARDPRLMCDAVGQTLRELDSAP